MVIRELNQTAADFPSLTLHELLERQVEVTPDAVALIFEGERLSYRELNDRANQLAHHLRGLGLRRGMLAGICLPRSSQLIISLLAILKAGAAYVILDPDYPEERLAYMLADAQPSFVIDRQITEITQFTSARSVEISADDLAYVIYTSGSTGEPKAVMISHRAISNHMQWFAREFPLAESDRTLLNHSISFDAAVDQIFQPLITGAGLVIVPPDRQYDIDYLVQLIREEQVTVLDVVPTLFKALIEDGRIGQCGSLRRAISSGEVLSVALKDDVYRLLPQVELVNLYGPTEASITATYHRCSAETDERTVPIGKPVANTQVYILDENLEPLPAGVAAEIYIGGSGLAWGYLNRPQLTAEKFIPDPFSAEAGARLYKTGDLGRYSANGNIEYVGRVDTQVKVRGFRIELGEIEAKLREHEAVRDAVAIARQDEKGNKRLVAYVIAGRGLAVTPDELRRYLKDKLPEHMIPAVVVLLDHLPLMPSGKVDVRSLPAPDEIRTEEDYVAPRTSVEKELARIWQEVLGVERVGITDNFFELGGDSIVSIQIVARARDAGLLITPRQVLQHASILELAAVTQVSRAPADEEELSDGRAIPLTPIQHWFFEQELPDPHHYNQAVMLKLKQPARVDLLEKTLERLIEHHDALRLRFERRARAWEQTIAANETHQFFERVDLSGVTPDAQAAEIERIANHAQSSLNLSEGPLIRAVYFDLGAGRPDRLLIVIHHLAVDGVSWRILLDDMQRAYEQVQRGDDVTLPAKTLSFRRWSELLG
ncbi:MAG TPA: amino acid adenylation domain-containing protein, partial [Pyrinomonadaceae bacterium]|nr:amino acid adenylation domain-containing protein [Pyrinomonadaceae bacterium]